MIALEKNFKETVNEQIKNAVSDKESQKSNIEKLFENFTGNYNPIEIDFGEPTGQEIW